MRCATTDSEQSESRGEKSGQWGGEVSEVGGAAAGARTTN